MSTPRAMTPAELEALEREAAATVAAMADCPDCGHELWPGHQGAPKGCDVAVDGDRCGCARKAPRPGRPVAAHAALALIAEIRRVRALAEELLREAMGLPIGTPAPPDFSRKLALELSAIRGEAVTPEDARAWWEAGG